MYSSDEGEQNGGRWNLFPTVDSHRSANSHFYKDMFIHNAQTDILPKAVLSSYAKQSKKPTQ